MENEIEINSNYEKRMFIKFQKIIKEYINKLNSIHCDKKRQQFIKSNKKYFKEVIKINKNELNYNYSIISIFRINRLKHEIIILDKLVKQKQ